MRKSLWIGVLALVLLGLTPLTHAQAKHEGPAKREAAQDEKEFTWRLINTALFAVLVGWGIAKAAPGFFNARSADIQKAIKDATGLKIEADFRYSEIDRKMATLGEEVKRMRAEAAADLQREHERMQRDTEHELQRISGNVQAEIEALQAEASRRIRRQTADAALALSEQQLHDRAVDQEGAVQDFVQLVGASK